MPKLLLVMVLTLLVAAPAAMAGTRADILKDCDFDGDLDGNYTPSEIRDARNNIPADMDQYSPCRDVLSRALGGTGDKQLPSPSGGGGGGDTRGGGGGGAPSEPLAPSGAEEQAQLDKAAASGGDAPVQVGSGTVVPSAGTVHHTLPVTLLVAMILLGVAALAGAVPPVRRRVLARRLA